MRRLLALAFLLLAWPSFAQVGPLAGIGPSPAIPNYPALEYTAVGASAVPSWMTFARADCSPSGSCASYYDSSGHLQFATTNSPRFDHDPVTHAATGLLIEEARTNLAVNSNALTGASWSVNLIGTPTQDGTLGPDGTASAWLITPTASTGNHYASDAVPVITTAVNYGKAVYVKPAGNNFILMLVKNNAATNWTAAVFDLSSSSNTSASQTLTGGTSAIVSTSQQAVGGGWYRIAMVSSFTGTAGNLNLQLAPAATANTITAAGISWTTTGTETVYLYGADWELGSTVTSYIPVSSTGVTRAADLASSTDATALGLGAWVVQVGQLQAATASTLLGINTGIGLGETAANALTTAYGGAQTTGNTATWTGTNAGGIAFDSTPRVSIDLNGGTVVTAANAQSAPTALYFGNTNNGASAFINGHVQYVAGYRSLTDALLKTKAVVRTFP